ncbi:hypothetical protein DFH08DRAFT_811813 [Mycena albidolilacea]|uniref:Uncharacterized protein n=1 Tax=Mycena albidolilacea TaxID=1033008 RepID=A0AAD7EMJ5_9AGAR|nr:hypothetical protein DFH08DRAFT_811813 [Mycena albidolilacea]
MCTGSLRIAKGAACIEQWHRVLRLGQRRLRSRCASGSTCRGHGKVSAETQQRVRTSCSEAVGSAIVLEGDEAQDLLGLCRACEREDEAGRRAAKMAGAIIRTLCGGDSLTSRIKTAGSHRAWL